MIQLKPGVKLTNLSPQMVLAIHAVDGVYQWYGVERCVLTSVDDRKHGPTTLHGKGQAVDFRIHNVPRETRPVIVEAIKRDLLHGEGQFEVYWEGVGTPEEHLHLEWDPK